MKSVVALYRSPAYSPSQHRQNDRAIMDGVLEQLGAAGWRALRVSEEEIGAERLPSGELYLNMCQGPTAAIRLVTLLPPAVPCLNTPESVLACHRHRLVPLLRRSGVPFPPTVLLRTTGPTADAPPVHLLTDNGHPIWVKRGDVHAQCPEDVVAVRAPEVRAALADFAARGVERVALQTHLPGPVVKFYGVRGAGFFHWLPAASGAALAVDAAALQAIAEFAARVLGLTVYGGDAVFTTPDTPVLIDLNDWPSFAPVRGAAAAAIARAALRQVRKERRSCSTP